MFRKALSEGYMRHLSHIGEWYCSAATDASRLRALFIAY